MSNRDDIDSIIAAYLSKRATREDIEKLEIWKSESKENSLLLECLQDIWKEKNAEPIIPHHKDLSDEIWQKSKKR